MPTPDVLTIAGTAIDLARTNTSIDHLTAFARGGVPQLAFSRLVGTPKVLPDPWHLKSCTLTMQGTVVFAGTVSGYIDRYLGDFGWIREYRAFGPAWGGNYVPVTDAVTLTDTSTWCQAADDPATIPSREGQAVGAIAAAILTMTQNANPLAALGIGAYTSLAPPTLPAATVADLAALTVIPGYVVRVIGERILPALEAFVQQFHPNHFLYVQPDGTIRFLDPRTFAVHTVTLNDPTDHRWGLPELTRDATDNYSRVLVRGNTLVRAVTLQDKPWPGSTAADGGLAEDFAHDGLTNAAAKAAWHYTDWSQPNQAGAPMDAGACTCTDTTHIVIHTTLTFAANQLAQGPGQLLGWVNLVADSLGGLVSQYWLARIVSNTATSGGTCTITIDAAVPATVYNAYQLFGLAAGENVVGRRYLVTNAAIAHQLQLAFPYPVPFVAADDTSASMVSSPQGIVSYDSISSVTGPPYTVSTIGLTVDPTGGLIYFDKPVQVVAGGTSDPPVWPAIVQAFVAVATGTLNAVAPASGYAGTLFTIEGVQRTKTITVLEWRDYSNQANMNLYASEVLDSVKDVVVEGSLPYFGLPDPAYLTPGRSVSIAGNDFTTGWESIALPVVSVEVAFQYGPQGTSYATTLQLSNRRQPYDASNFLRPAITGLQMGGGTGTFGAGLASSRAESAELAAKSVAMTAEGRKAAAGFTGTVADTAGETMRGLGRARGRAGAWRIRMPGPSRPAAARPAPTAGPAVGPGPRGRAGRRSRRLPAWVAADIRPYDPSRGADQGLRGRDRSPGSPNQQVGGARTGGGGGMGGPAAPPPVAVAATDVEGGEGGQDGPAARPARPAARARSPPPARSPPRPPRRRGSRACGPSSPNWQAGGRPGTESADTGAAGMGPRVGCGWAVVRHTAGGSGPED